MRVRAPQLEQARWARSGVRYAILTAAVALATGAHASRVPDAEAEEALLESPAKALRAALGAAEAGERSRAIELLGSVADRHPIVADHAALLRVRMLLEADRPAEAVVVALRALQDHPESRLRAELYQLLGDARAHFEDAAAARAAWAEALAATRDAETSAALRLAIARSLDEEGERRAAADAYTELWIHQPTSSEAREAEARLEVLEARPEVPARGADEWRRRADRLLRKRDNDGALAAYDRALSFDLSAAERRRIQKQRAHTLFRMRRYAEAVEQFTALPQRNDVPLWRARSLARVGEVPQAIAEFEAIAKEQRGELSVRARFLAGLLLDGRDFHDRARAHFEQVSRYRQRPSLAHAALWRLGWSAYRDGRYVDAVDLFRRLAQGESDAISGLRARYWRARALERLGDVRARHEFAAMAREFPLSYYGWRAAERGDGAGPLLPVPEQEIRTGRAELSPHQLERPRILLAAGLVDEAEAELDFLSRRARGLGDRLELAQLYADAGDYHGAQRVVVDAYTEALARGPVPRLEELWWYAWPIAYEEFVEEAVHEAGGIEPELVLSIMREESGYRPKVVSAVGARGLLQIMSETGEQLARSVGRPFSADDLFDPQTNIGLGSHYLSQLSRRFRGRPSASIASYNAGPHVVVEWMKEDGQADDEWVEAIPYDQTRSYVKRVLRSLRAYRILY